MTDWTGCSCTAQSREIFDELQARIETRTEEGSRGVAEDAWPGRPEVGEPPD